MNASAYTPSRPLRSRHVALRYISMHLSEWGAPPGDADAPLLVLLIVFGFFPKPLLQVADNAAQVVMTTVGETDPAPTIQGEN